MSAPHTLSFSDRAAGWRRRIEALAIVARRLDPTGSLDPQVWPEILTWSRLCALLTGEVDGPTPLQKDIQDYLAQLPGYAEQNERRLRLQHEVTLLLWMGGLQPLTTSEIEDLGLEDGDESEAG